MKIFGILILAFSLFACQEENLQDRISKIDLNGKWQFVAQDDQEGIKSFKSLSYTEFGSNPYELLIEKKARFIDQKVKRIKGVQQ